VTHQHPEPPDRRSFLDWAIHGIGAVFAVVLGVPVVGYLIDPRNRPKSPSDYRAVSGIKLGLLGETPMQGVIRNVRRDAWTLYPDDVIGRVWVHRVGPGKTKADFQVFSTICPHLGCSINCNADQAAEPGFTCPCHNGRFALDGSRLPDNPATRGMFALAFEVAEDLANADRTNRDLLKVQNVFITEVAPAAKV